MISTSDYLKWFVHSVPDEHCYISNLHKHGLQDQLITTSNIAEEATTFTNWGGKEYPFPSIRGLKNYSVISNEELLYLLNSKSLFARKFKTNCISLLSHTIYLKSISTPNS